jgi:opacity protein-like surface antigen
MKQLIQLSLISTLLLSQSTQATNPIQGFYGGVLAEISHGDPNYTLTFVRDNLVYGGTVNNSVVGGGGAGVIGYRIQNVRLEGEILVNYVSAGTLSLGTCTLQSPAVRTPTGMCADALQENAIGFNGSTTAGFGLINVFYDFMSYDTEQTLIPYIGIGIGASQLKKSVNFINTTTLEDRESIGYSVLSRSTAAQAIVGISFFLDDYAWAGMDYRYVTTNSLEDNNNSRYALNTLNFNINFSFDNSAN